MYLASISILLIGYVFYRINKPFAITLSSANNTLFEEKSKDKPQDIKNREFVSEIIRGHHRRLRTRTKNTAVKAFTTWQLAQKLMFKRASEQWLALRQKYIADENLHAFKPQFSTRPPYSPNATMFLQNAFTEPFPSLHDYDDWARAVQITDIFILHGITPAESHDYFVHEKYHFVNRKMERSIIWFDLYKLSI
jgi:hypothetical protein